MKQIARDAVKNEFKTNFQIENQLDIINKKIAKGCPQHQGEVQMWFCKVCQKVICQFCVQEDHAPPDHEVTLLEGIAEEKRKKLENRKETISKAVGKLEKVCTQIEHELENIQSAKTKYQDHTQGVTDEIVRIFKQFDIVKDNLLTRHQDFDSLVTSQEMSLLEVYQEVLQDVDDYKTHINQLDDKLTDTNSKLLSDSKFEELITAELTLPEPPEIPTVNIPEPKEMPVDLLQQDLKEVAGLVKKIGQHLGMGNDEDESEASDSSVYYSDDDEVIHKLCKQ